MEGMEDWSALEDLRETVLFRWDEVGKFEVWELESAGVDRGGSGPGPVQRVRDALLVTRECVRERDKLDSSLHGGVTSVGGDASGDVEVIMWRTVFYTRARSSEPSKTSATPQPCVEVVRKRFVDAVVPAPVEVASEWVWQVLSRRPRCAQVEIGWRLLLPAPLALPVQFSASKRALYVVLVGGLVFRWERSVSEGAMAVAGMAGSAGGPPIRQHLPGTPQMDMDIGPEASFGNMQWAHLHDEAACAVSVGEHGLVVGMADGSLSRVHFTSASMQSSPHARMPPVTQVWRAPLRASPEPPRRTRSRWRAALNATAEGRESAQRRSPAIAAVTASPGRPDRIVSLTFGGEWTVWDADAGTVLACSETVFMPLHQGRQHFVVPLPPPVTGTSTPGELLWITIAFVNEEPKPPVMRITLSATDSSDMASAETGIRPITSTVLHQNACPLDPVHDVALTPDGRYLFIAWSGGRVSYASTTALRDLVTQPTSTGETNPLCAVHAQTLREADESNEAWSTQAVLDAETPNAVERLLVPGRFSRRTVWLASAADLRAERREDSHGDIDDSVYGVPMTEWDEWQAVEESLRRLAEREPERAHRWLSRARALYRDDGASLLAVGIEASTGWPLLLHNWGAALLRPCDAFESVVLSRGAVVPATLAPLQPDWLADLFSPGTEEDGASLPSWPASITQRLWERLRQPIGTVDDVRSRPTGNRGVWLTMAAHALPQVAVARYLIARLAGRRVRDEHQRTEWHACAIQYRDLARMACTPVDGCPRITLAEYVLCADASTEALAAVISAFAERFRAAVPEPPGDGFAWMAFLSRLFTEPPPQAVLAAVLLALAGDGRRALPLLNPEQMPVTLLHLQGLVHLQFAAAASEALACWEAAARLLDAADAAVSADDHRAVHLLTGNVAAADALEYREWTVRRLDDERAGPETLRAAQLAIHAIEQRQQLGQDAPGNTDERLVRLRTLAFTRALEAGDMTEALAQLVADSDADARRARDSLYVLVCRALDTGRLDWLLQQPLPPLLRFRVVEVLARMATAAEVSTCRRAYERAYAAALRTGDAWTAARLAAEWAVRARGQVEARRRLRSGVWDELVALQADRYRALHLAVFALHQSGERWVSVPLAPIGAITALELERQLLLVRCQLRLLHGCDGRDVRPPRPVADFDGHYFDTGEAAVRATARKLVDMADDDSYGQPAMLTAVSLLQCWYGAGRGGQARPTAATDDVLRHELQRLARHMTESVMMQVAASGAEHLVRLLRRALRRASRTAAAGVHLAALEAWLALWQPSSAAVTPRASPQPLPQPRDRTTLTPPPPPQWLMEAAAWHEHRLAAVLDRLLRHGRVADAARLATCCLQQATAAAVDASSTQPIYVPVGQVQSILQIVRRSGSAADPCTELQQAWHVFVKAAATSTPAVSTT
ncbi:hypothetical protein CDCA_CDCA04G1343 [Cyanidium caldarium]|uniref:NUP160 middle TPR domain-containing protein n=1 Tax=Cyanidium caldarium TaxID=2771 RepID=A0AAV9ISS9_CYACA|nr:hypothetical protein CDCA_CDCA04G1343 [Cyanidium caldarium]